MKKKIDICYNNTNNNNKNMNMILTEYLKQIKINQIQILKDNWLIILILILLIIQELEIVLLRVVIKVI